MSDNEKPVDLGPIELRLRAAMQEKESYSPGIGSDILNDWPTIMDEDYDFVTAPLAQELFDHAPTDIAALLEAVKTQQAEVTRLRRNIDFLIHLWGSHSEYSRATAKLSVVVAQLEGILTDENLYSLGEE